jgi:hypothetical protein
MLVLQGLEDQAAVQGFKFCVYYLEFFLEQKKLLQVKRRIKNKNEIFQTKHFFCTIQHGYERNK